MSEVKTRKGLLSTRNWSNFITWDGYKVDLWLFQKAKRSETFTLIFKKELNPFWRFESHPVLNKMTNMSFMNEAFFNMFNQYTGMQWLKDTERKEILIAKLWHSFMMLTNKDLEKQQSLLVDVTNFMRLFENWLIDNGYNNPSVVITFENNFLVERPDFEVIITDFKDIKEIDDLPVYSFPYIPLDNTQMTLFRWQPNGSTA